MDADAFFNDVFADMFGGGMGGHPHSHGPAGGPRPRQRRKTQTPPSQVDLSVSLEELFCGAHKTLLVERTRTCASCSGSGAKPNREAKPCVKCSGQGQTYAMRQMGPYVQRVPVKCTACQGRGLKVRDQDLCVIHSGILFPRSLSEKRSRSGTSRLTLRARGQQVQEVQG